MALHKCVSIDWLIDWLFRFRLVCLAT